MLLGEFFRAHLRVGRGIRVNYQRLDIGHIRKERENLQTVDELPGIFLSSFDFEGEDCARA